MAPQMPPGTVRLAAADSAGSIILHPKPTDDLDDPLRWPAWRKALHCGIALVYVAVTFVLTDSSFVTYPELQAELDITPRDVATATALQFTGLGVAGVVLIPLAYRYGRRPIYLLSVFVLFGSALWMAGMLSKSEYLFCNIIVGVGGSIAQSIVPITIADLFFVHQFATMNGWFMFAQSTGAFLGPVAAGFVVAAQGWRWLWWSSAILLAVAFVMVLFLLEESTFVPATRGLAKTHDYEQEFFNRPYSYGSTTEPLDLVDFNRRMSVATLDLPAVPKTWRQRLALITKTKRPIRQRFISPFIILVTFPAVAYAAVTYGATMAWLALFVQVISTRMISPPYNLDPKAIGLFSLAPFLGHILGSLVIAPLSDRWIVQLARQNGGMYQPEMRLRLAIPGGVITCGGILMFGLSIAQEAQLPVVGIGFALFAMGFSICLVVALAYVADCYQNIIGDALVGVVFVRNATAVAVILGVIPWVDTMGLQNVFILTAATAAVVLLIPIPLMLWGEKARMATAAKYRHYSLAAIPPKPLKPSHLDWPEF